MTLLLLTMMTLSKQEIQNTIQVRIQFLMMTYSILIRNYKLLPEIHKKILLVDPSNLHSSLMGNQILRSLLAFKLINKILDLAKTNQLYPCLK